MREETDRCAGETLECNSGRLLQEVTPEWNQLRDQSQQVKTLLEVLQADPSTQGQEVGTRWGCEEVSMAGVWLPGMTAVGEE